MIVRAIGEGAVTGAGAVAPPGKAVPPRGVVVGVPGREVREQLHTAEDTVRPGGSLPQDGETEHYMRQALALAEEAARAGEVPVGCVIVREGVVVGRGRNRREEKNSALSHAEIEAIAQANAALGSWRLDGCQLYVTLEPCPMCAGAILNARLDRVWFGARDPAMGACGGVLNLFMEDFPNRPALVGGILEEECREALSGFFRGLRGSGTQ